MKRQVSIKVYMDEDLYQYYSTITDGRKGKVVCEALRLYRDYSSTSSARSLAKIKEEIRQGFQRMECLLKNCSSASRAIEQYVPQKDTAIKGDMDDMFAGFIQGADD